MINHYRRHEGKEQGFTLFIAIIIMATLLLVSAGIINLAIKESFLTSASRDSQFAFYAADTGAECAIYWDVKNSPNGVPAGHSAFATSTAQSISCNGQSFTVGGTQSSSFTMTFLPNNPYCAVVTVTKGSDNTTKIESLGYNTCDAANAHRVERAVRVSY